MFLTGVPVYAAASPFLPPPLQHFMSIPASPMVVPVQVASPFQHFQAPVAAQSPVVLPPTTIVQSAPFVPSPVIHAPIAIHPPRDPPPRHPRSSPQRDDDGAASVLLVQPLQQTSATPTTFTLNMNFTPQQQTTSLRDHPQDVHNNHHPASVTVPVTIPASLISRTIQNPSNGSFSVQIQLPVLPPVQFDDQS